MRRFVLIRAPGFPEPFVYGGFVSALPILYSFRRCPYAMRARLAIAVSAQVCELREVVLRDKPAELLQASPKGTVPVLVVGDRVIEQSLDIMLWALGQNDPQAWLKPEVGSDEDMLELIHSCDQDFKPCLDRYKYPQRYENIDALEQRQHAGRWLEQLEGRLKSPNSGRDSAGAGGKPGLFGQRDSLADAAIMPFVRQFAQVDRAWFDAQPWPALHAWLSRWLQSPLFDTAMVRNKPWKQGQGPSFP